jgi:hypothetical protein
VIQIKTGAAFFSGTYASVYIYLHGPKYATRKLYINGTYVRDGVVESTLWAEDVTPVSRLTILLPFHPRRWKNKSGLTENLFFQSDIHMIAIIRQR